MTENGVNWRHAAGVGGAVLVIVYVVLRWWVMRGNVMPHGSWFALFAIVLLSFAVLSGGWEVRTYLRGTSTRPPSPQRARRTLVAAQACVLVGSTIGGWYAAYALLEVGRLSASSAFVGMIQALVLMAASVGAVVAGLLTQGWCRIPKDEEDNDSTGGGPVHV